MKGVKTQQRIQATHPVTHRWSRDEYFRLTDLGWFEGQRVELIEGRIVHMPAQRNPHAFSVHQVQKALEAAFGPKYWVRAQMTLNLVPFSAPDPDAAVVLGPPTRKGSYPTTALLVVEVSDSTLVYDRTRKAAIYARAGIAEYWIVNLVDHQLEVHRNPVSNASSRPRHRYQDIVILPPGSVISPLAMPKAVIRVRDLL